MVSERSTGKKDNTAKSGKARNALEAKRQRALDRQAEYAALTTEEKRARIHERPGDSKREMARLQRVE